MEHDIIEYHVEVVEIESTSTQIANLAGYLISHPRDNLIKEIIKLLFIIRKCNYTPCSKDYQAQQRYLNRGQGLFCSKECSWSFRRELPRTIKDPNTICDWCQVHFYRKPSIPPSKSGLYYCSREHQVLAQQSGRFRTGPASDKMTYKCSNCNKRTRKENLCLDCQLENDIKLWLSGNIEITWRSSNKEPRAFVKEYLINTRGDECEVCGFSEKHPEDGKSIIQMDHIDGNYMNNHPDNLRLLCPNHHALTPTYGGRNKGNGRPARRVA